MVKQNKTSVHLSPTLLELHRNLPGNRGFGGRLSTIVDRYNELMRGALPRHIRPKQWGILMTVIKDLDFQKHPMKAQLLEQHLIDFGRYRGGEERFGQELDDLIAKVGCMEYPNLLAIVHFIETEIVKLSKT